MTSEGSLGVSGRRLLIVEDEYLIAWDLASWLESKGAEVIGPVPSVVDALAVLKVEPLPDAAVLDINLGDEQVFPVADALRAAHVPFVFLSGYDGKIIPEHLATAPCCIKPLNRPRLLDALARLCTAAAPDSGS
jgi:CheY-like chemotaxis protein